MIKKLAGPQKIRVTLHFIKRVFFFENEEDHNRNESNPEKVDSSIEIFIFLDFQYYWKNVYTNWLRRFFEIAAVFYELIDVILELPKPRVKSFFFSNPLAL